MFVLLPTLLAASGVAPTPPLGYNSYDSYDWTMDEQALFATAAAMKEKLNWPSQ